MDCVSYKVTVPGSLMLFGEHAVLHGKKAVVAAINRYLRVNLIPRSDYQVKIVSQGFDTLVVSLDKLQVVAPYQYILTVIKKYLKHIPRGFNLIIETDFASNLGFGSSAAVTVAVLAVLRQWLGMLTSSKQLYRQALKVIHTVQGFGSGADVAASIYGGVLAYQARPVLIEQLVDFLPLVAIYSGSKVTTNDVILQLRAKEKSFSKVFNSLYIAIANCTQEAILAIRENNWQHLGMLMNIHHGLQEALGVNNNILSNLIFSLREQQQIYGAKISGAGLGDCVIGLGKIAPHVFPENSEQKRCGVKQIDIAISERGLRE